MQFNGMLGFMGCGNMGRAILMGLLETGTTSHKHVLIYDIDLGKCEEAERLGLAVAPSARELASACDILLLAVKPQSMEEAIEQVKPGLSPAVLVISIAAGISIRYLQERLGPEVRIIRVMPNTPAMIGAGAAGIALGNNCSEKDAEIAQAIFGAIGVAERIPEEAMDAVTALSGSGPAYFFYMVECLAQAAAAEGLPEDQAQRLAAQTLLGAGRLLHESGEAPGVLRERVTSKGGTTEAALAAFRAKNFEEIVRAGVHAAAMRSRELGK